MYKRFVTKRHEVVLAKPEQLRDMIAKAGISFAPVFKLPKEQIKESFKVL